jgi:hypothetical protein
MNDDLAYKIKINCANVVDLTRMLENTCEILYVNGSIKLVRYN